MTMGNPPAPPAPARRRPRDWLAITTTLLLVLLVLTGLAQVIAGDRSHSQRLMSEGGGIIFLGAFTYAVGLIGYLMAMRRRRLPYEEQLREVHDGMDRVEGLLIDRVTPAARQPQRKYPYLVRLWSPCPS